MATRNLIMVVDRKHSSKYPEGFAIHPDLVNDKSYVNMYMHHDGYPEWQGVQIANWLLAGNNGCMDGARLASKLVHDMYYDSCYLYNSADRIDHEYRYIIWTDHRGWDDELIETHQKALSWFRTVNPQAYMVLLD